MYALVLSAFGVLVAGFIQSVSGFGFALVASPLLLFTIDAKSVVVIVTIFSWINNIQLSARFWRHMDKRQVLFIGLGAAMGVPVGAYLLSTLDSATIKLVIAILIIPFSLLLLRGYAFHYRRQALGCVVAGVLSGALAASTGLTGPPVILFLLGQNLDKEKFIGTISAYFLFTSTVTAGVFSFMGLVTADILKHVLFLLPAMVAGFYIGNWARHKIKASLFRKVAVAIIFASAVVIIIDTLLR